MTFHCSECSTVYQMYQKIAVITWGNVVTIVPSHDWFMLECWLKNNNDAVMLKHVYSSFVETAIQFKGKYSRAVRKSTK